MSAVLKFPTVTKVVRRLRWPVLQIYPCYSYSRRWIYSLGFADGSAKVGSTCHPRDRLKTHFTNAGGKVAWVHLSASWDSVRSAIVERFVCATFANRCHRGKEWFAATTRDEMLHAIRAGEAHARAHLEAQEGRMSRRAKKKAAA